MPAPQGKPSHESTAQPPSPEKLFVRPPPPNLIPPRPPAPVPAPPRPIPPPQVQDIPLRPPAPNLRPPAPVPALTGPVRLEKDPGKGKIKIIAPLKLPGGMCYFTVYQTGTHVLLIYNLLTIMCVLHETCFDIRTLHNL